MDANQETVQKRVVVNRPGQRSEVLTERTQTVPRESGPSTGMIAIIAIFAVTAIAATFYIVSNRNANEAANRNANLDVASQTQPIIQQPAPAQQAPVIIQQPAPAQQAPVIIEQPAPVLLQQSAESQRQNTSANDDAKMQDIATKRLTEDPEMALVVMTVTDARAVLIGTVNSAASKAKAELIVKGVRGMKSVDNKIVIAG